MRMITVKELDKAIPKLQGRIEDGMPILKLKVTNLRRKAIELLKEKVIRKGRLTEEETKVDDEMLMENLHLIDEEGYLIRAVMLVFYKAPKKRVTGIKYFGDSNAIIAFCSESKSPKEIVEKFAFPNWLYFKRHFLDEMLMNKKLKMTLPDKLSSRNQKYYS